MNVSAKSLTKRGMAHSAWRIAGFIAILIFALYLRRHTFDLPHYRGDQHHYTALAFKLEAEGITGYNLRGVDVYANKNYPELAVLAKAKDKGAVLKGLEADGVTYYDEPLHHIPFGFPSAIMLSHKVFAHGQPYFLIKSDETASIQKIPAALKRTQNYSVVVPLFSSLLLIALTYFIAKKLFNNNFIALTAMFLMSISPTDILTSQKIWADDTTSALMALAVLLYIISLDKKLPLLAFLGGISCGVSALMKQSGLFVIFVITVWHFASNWRFLFRRETFWKTLADKNILLFLAGSMTASAYWFISVFSVYGNPFYMPHQAGIKETAKTLWYAVTTHRPRCIYSVCPAYQNPFFILAYISPLWLWLDRKKAKEILFPLIWITVFLVIFQWYLGKGGKEERYMLPAFPAFAILAAYVAERIIGQAQGLPLRRVSITIIFIAALIASVFWSVPMAYEVLFGDGALIMKPF